MCVCVWCFDAICWCTACTVVGFFVCFCFALFLAFGNIEGRREYRRNRKGRGETLYADEIKEEEEEEQLVTGFFNVLSAAQGHLRTFKLVSNWLF